MAFQTCAAARFGEDTCVTSRQPLLEQEPASQGCNSQSSLQKGNLAACSTTVHDPCAAKFLAHELAQHTMNPECTHIQHTDLILMQSQGF